MSTPDRIYLDHAATTPVLPEAQSAMAVALGAWANPSSPHADGRAARARLEEARAAIADALGWRHDVIFTSGASEALSLALKTDQPILVSAVEHDAVFRAAAEATVIPIAGRAQIDRNFLADALRKNERAMVAVQHVNSETGVTQPVSEIASQVRESGGVLLSDCSQSAGKFPLPDADLIVVSAHKLGGPPGVGALLVRDKSLLQPTGGQEFGYRSGTENLPAIAGFAAALRATEIGQFPGGPPDALPMVRWLHDMGYSILDLEYPMAQAGGIVQPQQAGAFFSVHIIAVTIPGMSAAAQVARFDMAGVSVSAGSACSSGTIKTSRVLKAFGVPDDQANCTIRVSIGWSTSAEDIATFQSLWFELADEAKARAA